MEPWQPCLQRQPAAALLFHWAWTKMQITHLKHQGGGLEAADAAGDAGCLLQGPKNPLNPLQSTLGSADCRANGVGNGWLR